MSAETRRRLTILRGEFWPSAGGRRGPKFARMLLSAVAVGYECAGVRRRTLWRARWFIKISLWEVPMSGCWAGKFGLGRLRCVSEDSQTPQKRGEANCEIRKNPS